METWQINRGGELPGQDVRGEIIQDRGQVMAIPTFAAHEFCRQGKNRGQEGLDLDAFTTSGVQFRDHQKNASAGRGKTCCGLGDRKMGISYLRAEIKEA
jgi:hypothetical protein